MSERKNHEAYICLSDDQHVLQCYGHWTADDVASLESQLASIIPRTQQTLTVDGGGVTSVDSMGALFFQDLIKTLQSMGKTVTVKNLSDQFQSLLHLVATKHEQMIQPESVRHRQGFLYELGMWVFQKFETVLRLSNFIGELFVRLLYVIKQRRYRQWPVTLKVINDAGILGLPIVALLSFLIGIVLTYQIATQLTAYNVNVIIVDITGMVVLKEMGPLITAIIGAGRTSTAFTSEIGTMQVNEEIDALKTMGIVPMEQLVIPRVLGVLIALPLLTVWGNIFALFGSMVMSSYEMDVSYRLYIERFQDVIPVYDFIDGMLKSIAFALVIAIVGCFQGFSVERTASSVGEKTMQSAVQAIFLIIIVDAVFSFLFGWVGI